MTWRWRSLAAIPDRGVAASVLEQMLRSVLRLCRRAGLELHRDRVLAIVEEEYRGEQ